MRMGVNERRHRETRKATRYERMAGVSRWFFRKGLLILLLPVVLGAVGWFAWQGVQKLEFSKLVVLKRIEVDGNKMLAWESVLTAAKVEIGIPMLDIDVEAIEKSLEKLDLVQSATVKRSFPSSLVIHIDEAQPLFMESQIGGWQIFSDKGTRIPLGQDLGMQLPVVLSESKENRKIVVDFLCSLRNADPELYAQVSQVAVRDGGKEIEVFFRNTSHKVYFAKNGNAEAFHQYRLLVQSLGKEIQSAFIIDMRFPGMAVAKPGNRENKDG